MTRWTYELQDGDLHHALVEVSGLVLDDLDGDDLVGLHVLALDDLTERSLAKDIQNEVTTGASCQGQLGRGRECGLTCGRPRCPASR